jgi:hypothetical protein
MDPISLTLGLVGMAGTVAGGVMGAIGANKAYGIQQQEAGTEEAVNAQKQQQMVLSNRRQQLENFRNTQQARSRGEENAVSQGANLGSGYGGGQAQAQAQGNTNNVALGQNLQIGNNLFSLDNQLDQEKLALSGVQSSNASWAALGGVGTALTKASGTIGNLFNSGPSGNNATNNGNGTNFNLNDLY